MSSEVHRLVVMRHAKAEPFAASDHERLLQPRGIVDAAAAGHWADSVGLVPDYVVVSSAARTQGTWAAFARPSSQAEVVTDGALYGAGPDAALEIIRTVPEHCRTAMLVGHNPTMAYLVHLLDDGGADPELFATVTAGYPTSALTVLEFAGRWADLEFGSARIVNFHVGRG